ncbi:MAG: hypothetical protein DCC55_15830 [Chloroflexi bacterium]|nr:MAG: hypothetical protein DCC55_15830 [Chloroflexota bacterium]
MTTIRCPHCGTVNRSGSNFCNNCGAALRDETPPRPSTLPPFGEEPASTTPPPSEETKVDATLPDDELTAEQPWLRPVADEEEPAPAGEEVAPSRRLVGSVQGLLEPVRIFGEASDETTLAPGLAPGAPPRELGADQLRRLRSLMSEEPVLVERLHWPARSAAPALRLPGIFLLLGLLLLLGFVLAPAPAAQSAQPWPGVQEAFDTIAALPDGAPVLLLWGYDPATAGELDLLAIPLVAQLTAQRNQAIIVSLLPNGLASARRLFAQVTAPEVEVRPLQLAAADAQIVESAFLPGGAALPLVAQDLATGLNVAPGVSAAGVMAAVAEGPALAILLAAQTEDVQQWLEQAQPLNQLPVVAFTSAAADPLLRPYLESGQLAGLVSGFDGAWAYHQLSGLTLAPPTESRLSRQLSRQSWGQAAFLLALILGNLAALFGREGHG